MLNKARKLIEGEGFENSANGLHPIIGWDTPYGREEPWNKPHPEKPEEALPPIKDESHSALDVNISRA